MSARCICQICTCGRHHCPHTTNVVLPRDFGPCFQTENRDEYSSKWVDPCKPIRPDDEYKRGSGVMADQTCYRVDYTPKEGGGVIKRPPVAYVAPTTKLEDTTTYLIDYPAKDSSPAESFRPNLAYVPPSVKLMDESMMMASYKYPDPTNARPMPIIQDENLKTGGKFRGDTTFKVDFVDHGLTKKRSYIIHKEQDHTGKGPMDRETMYLRDYTWKDIPERFVLERTPYIPPSGKMAGNTTFRDHYIDHRNQERVLPIIQKPEFVLSSTPFSGTTTFKDSFKEWPVLPKMEMPWASLGKYTPSGLPFGCNTSYREDYIRHPEARNALILPKVNECPYGIVRGKMLDKTTYFDEYPRKVVSIPKLCRPDRSYRPTEGDIPESTNAAVYKGIYVPPVTPVKPPFKNGTEWAYGDEFYKDTSYRVDYVANKIGRCPAIKFVQNPQKYPVKELRGHLFYNPSTRSDEDIVIRRSVMVNEAGASSDEEQAKNRPRFGGNRDGEKCVTSDESGEASSDSAEAKPDFVIKAEKSEAVEKDGSRNQSACAC